RFSAPEFRRYFTSDQFDTAGESFRIPFADPAFASWILEYQPRPTSWSSAVLLPLAVLLAGLSLTTAAVFMIAIVERRKLLKSMQSAVDIAMEQADSANSKLTSLNRQLAQIINSVPDGFVVYDRHGGLLLANQAFREINAPIQRNIARGLSRGRFIQLATTAGIIQDGTVPDVPMLAMGNNSGDPLSVVSSIRLSDDRWMQCQVSRLDTGECVELWIDVTNHKAREEELQRLHARSERALNALEAAQQQIRWEATHDSLTACGNRRKAEAYLREALRADRREPLAILQIDLDSFKQVNDTLGHPAGDEVLKEVARRLSVLVSGAGLLARFGGDEFVVVLRGQASVAAAERLADDIVTSLSRPIIAESKTCQLGASVGIAHLDETVLDYDDLLANADAALYMAKRAGKNRCHSFTPAMRLTLMEDRKRANLLLEAVEKGQFEAFYQPQICAQSHRIVACEALARWNHPERGVLSPAEFLTAAAEVGISDAIDETVLLQAVNNLADLTQNGFEHVRLSLNVSSARLRSTDLIDQLTKLDVAYNRLSFEILESVYLDNSEDIIQHNLDGLRDLGIDIELDNFGSGQASIIGLTNLHPRRLKLDRRLVASSLHDPQAHALLLSLIEIGKSLDVEIIAEGVETPGHIAALGPLGIDYLQGFAIARPMQFATLLQFLSEYDTRNDDPHKASSWEQGSSALIAQAS
ncbi:MAG: EAL domain-containing protein, partial [Pseudomonadota bacterium]